MSEAMVFLVGAVAAAVAVTVVSLRRRRRGPVVTGIVGAALLAVSVAVGLVMLPDRQQPEPLFSAVGVLPPPPVLPRPGRGFAISMATDVNGCSNPVSVTLVAAGTSEYWADYRAETRGADRGTFPFVLVLPTGVTGAVRVGLASAATDITDPVGAEFAHPDKIQVLSQVRAPERTIVSGLVRDWPRTLLPLVATFKADWLAPRGLSTCYLRLPTMSGSRTAGTVVAALGGCRSINARYRGRACTPTLAAGSVPYVPQLLVSLGESIVTVRSGDVAPDLSVPPPPTVVSGEPSWTCNGAPDTAGAFPARAGARVPDVVGGVGGGAAYSTAAIAGVSGGTCRAVAVITENSAAYARDLLILVIGAVMGLGLTLVVQAVLDAFASRVAGPAPAAGEPLAPAPKPAALAPAGPAPEPAAPAPEPAAPAPEPAAPAPEPAAPAPEPAAPAPEPAAESARD